jgi:pimeloyl-ACP methyl ester carboxylesterase
MTQEVRIAFDDGAATVLERWGDAGPNLLCVHGLTSSRRGWVRFANRFGSAYRVYAYDQRGHGDAAGVHGPMTLDRCVRDLEAVVKAIPGPIDALIGHSWGGAVVILGGLRIPARTVIAVDPLVRVTGANWDAEFVDELRPIFEHTGAERERAVREAYAGLDPLDLAGKVHAMRSMSIEPIRRLGSENGADAGGIDLRERMVNYPLPLYLALADAADSIVVPSDVDFIRAQGGSNVTIRVFPGEGHSLHRSAFDAFSSSVEAFLA